MFTKALVLLASLSAAFASPYITQPVASTTFHGGQNGTVTWQDNGSDPSLAKFGPCSISIYVGNALQQTSLQTLTPSVDVSNTSSISFKVDPTIGPNSSEYFIRLESLSLKDTASPQYPAMAFSAKFTLDNMTGTFSTDVQNQIKGQSTAPLASPTSTVSKPVSVAATTTGFTTSTVKPSSTSATKPTSSSSGAEAIVLNGSWIGFLLATFFGVALF